MRARRIAVFRARHPQGGFDRCCPERRASFRLPTARNRVRLAWWEGDQVCDTFGWIANLGPHGALLTVDRLPPPGPTVSLRLEWPLPSPWCEVQVMRVRGLRELGIVFRDGCPAEFLGLISEGAPASKKPRGLGGRVWS